MKFLTKMMYFFFIFINQKIDSNLEKNVYLCRLKY